MQRSRHFQTAGVCIPDLHYMVDMSAAIEKIIGEYVENGAYFTINRARQFGKTTILELLNVRLKQAYVVAYISFEAADDCFVSLYTFAQGFTNKVETVLEEAPISEEVSQGPDKGTEYPLRLYGQACGGISGAA